MKKNSRINIKVSDRFKAQVVEHIQENRLTISEYVLKLIEQDLNKQKDL